MYIYTYIYICVYIYRSICTYIYMYPKLCPAGAELGAAIRPAPGAKLRILDATKSSFSPTRSFALFLPARIGTRSPQRHTHCWREIGRGRPRQVRLWPQLFFSPAPCCPEFGIVRGICYFFCYGVVSSSDTTQQNLLGCVICNDNLWTLRFLECRRTPLHDFIRMSIYDKYSSSMKVITHLDYTSHCEWASGINWG